MRFKSLFLSMIAGLAFVGCSSDEELNGVAPNENGGTDAIENGTGYVAVNIVQPKSVGKRATTGDFENGSVDENFAREGLFFIFDKDGNAFTVDGKTSQRIALTGTEVTNSDPAVERIYNAILVINGIKDKPDNAKQIVCILNAPTDLDNITTLSALQEKTADYCTNKTTNGTFVMSNSVYYGEDNTTLIVGTPITEANIKTSSAAALANPVDIYVERVVAKVHAKEKENGMTINNVKIDVDGTEKTYKINIDGIALSNLTNTANLLKSLKDYSVTTWTWKDYTNRRSFWEVMTNLEESSVQRKSWNDISTDTHYDKTKNDFLQYILPNTFSTATDEVINTSIIVAAHLTETSGETTKNADLVWIRGGYTTNSGALNVIANAISNQFAYYKKTGDNTYKLLESSDFNWNGDTNKGYSCHAELSNTNFGADTKIYTYKNGEATVVEGGQKTVNDYLSEEKNNLHARKYTDGKCYYYVEIEHVAAATGENAHDAIKGIVRNHIYELTLNSIQGPGIPVFDPSEVVIPQNPKDDELFYLGARVNVLDWRIVAQGIDFGKE